VFTVADYAGRSTADKYAVDSTQHTSVPLCPPSQSTGHVPVSSFASPWSLDSAVQSEGSYSGSTQLDRPTARFHADESFSSFSSSSGQLNSHNVDYYGRVSVRNWSDSVPPPAFSRQAITEPRSSRCGPCTPRDGDLRSREASTGFGCFAMDHSSSSSALPAARSGSRSPAFHFADEPSAGQMSSSMSGDVSRSRRLCGPEARSSAVDLVATDRRCRVVGRTRANDATGALRAPELDSIGSSVLASDGARRCIGSCPEQSDRCNRKRQYHHLYQQQQQLSAGSSGSLLFAQKLAKLRALRYKSLL